MKVFSVGDIIKYVIRKRGQPTYRIVEIQENSYILEAIFPNIALFGVKLPFGKKRVECKLNKELAHGFYTVDSKNIA